MTTTLATGERSVSDRLLARAQEIGQAEMARLLARFYRPDGHGPFPAVLEVHGGAWTGGDRLNNAAIGLPA